MTKGNERQITSGAGGRILTNVNVWSPDSEWIVYDTRSDTMGDMFDGPRIEMVNVKSGEVRTIYEARNGARCGVATFHPSKFAVVFILGPEFPASDWPYSPAHRQGVLIEIGRPDAPIALDARDLTPPFTPGALSGGSHVHVFSPDGDWLSFTYNDHFANLTGDDRREVAVAAPAGPVTVSRAHPRSHDGLLFSVVVTRTTAHPTPGSDEIARAFEDGWIGTNGYEKPDGTRQKRALAFQGEVRTARDEAISEVFVADIPDDVTQAGETGPLAGTETRRPQPPRGTSQRRLTFTADAKFPGIEGPRHWLRASPDGREIAFLRRDDAGRAQIWTVSPNGGPMRQITRDAWGIASAFTWSPNGKFLTYAADYSVFVVESATGNSRRLTPRSTNEDAPLLLACVFAPNGRQIAYQRRVFKDGGRHNQIFVVEFSEG